MDKPTREQLQKELNASMDRCMTSMMATGVLAAVELPLPAVFAGLVTLGTCGVALYKDVQLGRTYSCKVCENKDGKQ